MDTIELFSYLLFIISLGLKALITSVWGTTILLGILLLFGVYGILKSKGRSYWTIFIVGSCALALFYGYTIIYSEPSVSLEPYLTKEDLESPIKPAATEQITDTNWTLYQNNKLGFSIQQPKFAKYTSDKVTPITVLEQDNQVAFTLNPQSSIDQVRSWKISIIPIASREELTTYIKSRYEQGCEVRELVPSKQTGVYDVLITGTAPDIPDEQRCFVNWLTINKYFPERGILANWDIGQDANFFSATDEVLDTEMAESFKFIP